MNKNIISIIIIVLLLGLAIFVLVFKNSPNKSPISSIDIEKPELKLNKIEEKNTKEQEEIPIEEKVVVEETIIKPTNPLKANIVETQIKEIYVSYENGLFSPSTIIVDKNTKVIWTNKSDIPMKVGSSPYPTHSNLPEMVQKKAVAKGGTYSFIFLNSGSYNYQNDSKPNATGTIMVK